MRYHRHIIQHLIEVGADVNAKSERGSSPLLALCQHNDVDLARLLIKHGARYDVQVNNAYNGKINGLIVAAESGSFDILKLLVESGLDVNYKIEGEVREEKTFFTIDLNVLHHPGRNSGSYTFVLCLCQRIFPDRSIFNRTRC